MVRWLQCLGVVMLSMLLSMNVYGGRRKKKTENKPFEWEAVADSQWNAQVEGGEESGAIMLFERIVVDDTKWEDDKFYCSIYRRILITSEEGRDQADIEAPYLSANQVIYDIQGRTILPGGEEIPLKEENIFEKDVVRFEEEKISQKSFSLPGVTENCIIEYVLKYRKASMGVWHIQKDIPLAYGELTWKYHDFTDGATAVSWSQYFANPKRKPLKIHNIWENVSFEKSRLPRPAKDPTEYIYKVYNVPSLSDEPYDIPEEAASAKLHCFYGPKMLSIVYWSNLTNLLSKYWVDKYDESSKAKSVASEFTHLATDREKILAVYSWLQDNLVNLTYLSDERASKILKKKKLKTIKTFNDALKNGYGDRSDIDRAFCAILNELGIKAGYVHSVDRTEGSFNRDVMAWLFDRSLTFVVENEDTTFYSPGHLMLEPGMTPWFSEGTTSLEESPQGSRIITPYSTAETNRMISTATFTMSDDLRLAGEWTKTSIGHPARHVRLMAYGEEESEVIRLIKDELKEELPTAEVSDVSVTGDSSLIQPVIVSSQIKFPELTTIGDRLVIKLSDYLGGESNPFNSEERLTDVRFKYAYELVDTIKLVIPGGWLVEGIPSDTTFDNQAGRCSAKYEADGNQVKVRFEFVLSAPHWNVEDYSLIRGLFTARQAMSEGTIVLKTGG